MKKLILLIILSIGTQSLQAQNAQLSKQQTLDYIEKLFKASYKYDADAQVVIINVILDGKTLQVNISSGIKERKLLDGNRNLEVSSQNFIGENKYMISYNSSKEPKDILLWNIQTEEDAKRLKKALEHLIEILKTEKNTDPFGE